MSVLGQLLNILAAATPPAQAERTRAEQNDDADFAVADALYYFELVLPASLLGRTNQSFLIPLVLGPNALSFEEPFSVDAALTHNGLYVEEHGIVQRTLRIRGNTGWAPIVSPIDQAPGYLAAGDNVALSVGKSFRRDLPRAIYGALSGKRHLEYLQDALRTYADAKRDPAHAAGVRLFFHNPRDNEDWEVVPRSFGIERSAGAPLTYPYSIDLLVVGPAARGLVPAGPKPDRTVLTAMRDALATAQAFVSVGTAYLNQLTAVEADMRRVFKNMGAVVNSCTTLLNAAQAFVSGAVSLIQAPYALCAQTLVLIDAALAQAQATGRQAAGTGALYAGIPALYVQAWRNLGDNLALLGTHPEIFAAPTQSQLAVLRANQALTAALQASSVAADPTSFVLAERAGGLLLAADVAQSAAYAQGMTSAQAFTGTHAYTVQDGDTLVSIAAKTMGDARLWVYVALANGLTLPLAEGVSTQNLSTGADTVATAGVLALGGTLLIPDYSQPVQRAPDSALLGTSPADDLATQVLGRDLALNFTQGGAVLAGDTETRVDLVLSPAGDDLACQSGVKNLQQAALVRLNTELGEDQLMPSMGLEPIVGLGLAQADAKAVQLRLKAALLADPRVAAVTDIAARAGAADDTVALSATLQVSGLLSSVALA